MIEQMNLFGEVDPLSLVCKMFRDSYDWWINHDRMPEIERHMDFSEFVLRHFSSYQGGTAPQELKDAGYRHYGCSPKGVELWRDDGNILVPKVKILRMLQVTDDHKDIMRDAYEVTQ